MTIQGNARVQGQVEQNGSAQGAMFALKSATDSNSTAAALVDLVTEQQRSQRGTTPRAGEVAREQLASTGRFDVRV